MTDARELSNDHFEEPSELETLKLVRDAYQRVLDEKDAELRQAVDAVKAKYAPVIASCLATFYDTQRRAYDAGFSADDMNRKLQETLQN